MFWPLLLDSLKAAGNLSILLNYKVWQVGDTLSIKRADRPFATSSRFIPQSTSITPISSVLPQSKKKKKKRPESSNRHLRLRRDFSGAQCGPKGLPMCITLQNQVCTTGIGSRFANNFNRSRIMLSEDNLRPFFALLRAWPCSPLSHEHFQRSHFME